MQLSHLNCPACKGTNFTIKYEATYVYSYNIDSDAPGTKNTSEFLPYMYDNREQTKTKQYLQCNTCGATYPCVYNQWLNSDINTLQNTINNDYKDGIVE